MLGEPKPDHRHPFSIALDAEPRPPPKLLTQWDGDKGAEPSVNIFQKFPGQLVCAVRDRGMEQMLRLVFQSCSVTQHKSKCPVWTSSSVPCSLAQCGSYNSENKSIHARMPGDLQGLLK